MALSLSPTKVAIYQSPDNVADPRIFRANGRPIRHIFHLFENVPSSYMCSLYIRGYFFELYVNRSPGLFLVAQTTWI